MPEFSSVANCLVKSMSWLLLLLRRKENRARLLSTAEVTSVTEDGWMLRIRNCFRAAKGLSAVTDPLVFLPPVVIAVYSYLGIIRSNPYVTSA